MTEMESSERKISADTQATLAYDASKKSLLLTYVLLFLLGWLGVHRFYIGRSGSAIAMLVIFVLSFIFSFVGVGLIGFFALGIWAFVDLFLMPGIVKKYNQDLIQRVSAGYLS